MRFMVIPHAHYRHSTNFHAVQDIINTSTPNTPQLAQIQAIKILWHSRALSLLLYHEWTDRWLPKCLPSICLLTSTKGTEISHPLDLMVMESSIVNKLLPIRALVFTQIFLHRVREEKFQEAGLQWTRSCARGDHKQLSSEKPKASL